MEIKTNNLVTYNDISNFIKEYRSNWESYFDGNILKIKTNEHTVNFEFIDQLKKKYNFKITEITFSDYYGIVFSIELEERN